MFFRKLGYVERQQTTKGRPRNSLARITYENGKLAHLSRKENKSYEDTSFKFIFIGTCVMIGRVRQTLRVQQVRVDADLPYDWHSSAWSCDSDNTLSFSTFVGKTE